MIKTRKTKDKIMIVDGKQRLHALICYMGDKNAKQNKQF